MIELREFFGRVSGIHEKIAKDAFGDAPFLECGGCGKRRSMTTQQGGSYLAKGWPKCCGYTMTLHTKPRVPDSVVPSEPTKEAEE